MKRLGNAELSVAALVSGDRNLAEDELYDLVCSDATLQQVLEQFGATRETLRSIFRDLRFVGAGQWESGVYVPVAALTQADTLNFILSHAAPPGDEFEQAWQYISIRLLDYFRTREMSNLSRDGSRVPASTGPVSGPLYERIDKLPDVAHIVAISALTPLTKRFPFLDLGAKDWDFFASVGAMHAVMERLRITLRDPPRVQELHQFLAPSLEEWNPDGVRALSDCDQFVLRIRDAVPLFDAIGVWVLWNVLQREPHDDELQAAPALGAVFKNFAAEFTDAPSRRG